MAKVGDGYVEVQPDLDMFAARLRAALSAVPADEEGRKVGNKVGVGFGTGMKAGIASMIGRTGLIAGVAAAFAGPVSAVISDLSASTVALAGSVAQATGVMANAPTIIGALGQGFAVTKIAGAGLSDALKALAQRQAELNAGGEVSEATQKKVAAAMANLGPEARGLASALIDQNAAWLKVRSSIQEKALKGAGSTVKALAETWLPVLEKRLGATATLFNRLGQRVAKWAQSKGVVRDFNTLLKGNNVILRNLAVAAGRFFDGFRHLMVATLPSSKSLSASIRRIATGFRDFMKQGRKSGALQQFFKDARVSGRLLWRLIINIGAALGHTFAVGSKSGDSMLRTLVRLTGKWNRWTKSADGKNRLKSWFDTGEKTARSFGRLLSDLGGMFGRLAKGSDGAGFIESLRGFVPPLERMLTALSQGDAATNLVDSLVGLTDALAGIVEAIPATGALTAFLTTLTDLVKPVADLASTSPAFASGLAQAGVAFGTWKAYSVVTKGVVGTGKGLVGTFRSVYNTGHKFGEGISKARGSLTRFREGFRDVRTGMSAFGTTAHKMGARVRTVTANMRVAGSVAKTGVVNGFSKAGSALKNFGFRLKYAVGQMGVHARAAAGVVKSQLALARAFTVSALAALRQKVAMVAQRIAMIAASVATKVMAATQAALNIVMRLNPIGLVITAITALAIGLVMLWKRSKTFQNIVMSAVHAVAGVFKWLWNLLWGNSILKDLIKVLGIVAKAFRLYFKIMWTVVKTVFKVIATVIKTYVKIWVAVIKTAWRVISTVVRGYINVVRTVISTGFRVVSTIIRTVLAVIKALITGNWRAIPGIIKGGMSKVWSTVKSGFGKVVTIIKGVAGDVLQAGKDTIQGFINGVTSMGGKLWSAITNFIKEHVPKPVQKLLGIASPSKLFRQFGVNTLEGFIEGVEDKGKRAAMIATLLDHYGKAAKEAVKGFAKGLLTNEATAKKAWTRLSRFADDVFTGKAQTAAKRMLSDMQDRWERFTKRREKMAARIAKAEKAVKDAIKARNEYAKEVAGSAIDFAAITGFQAEDGVTATASDFVADMRRRAAAVAQFAANVAILRKKGLNKATLAEIVNAGVDGGGAAAAALAADTASIAQVNSIQRELKGSAGSLGSLAADWFKQSGVDAAKGLVSGLRAKMRDLNKTMRDLAHTLAAALRKELGIKSPSRVFADIGDNTAEGFVKGVTAKQTEAQRAIHGLVAQPGRLRTPRRYLSGTPGAAEQALNVRVFIGDTELTDIVRTEVTKGNVALAKQVKRGRRVVA